MEICIGYSWIWAFFGILFGEYLYVLFKRKGYVGIWIILVCISGLFTYPVSKEVELGNYTIYEIHTNYVLARNGSSKLLIYGIDHPTFKNQYKVEYYEKIHSLNNIGLFNFESYMHHKGIDYSTNCSDEKLVYASHSLKSKIYTYISNHDYGNYYKSLFYGIHDETTSSLFTRLSLPFIAFLQYLKVLLSKKWDEKTSKYISLCIGLVLGSLFTFTPSFIRYLLFEWISLIFEDWKVKYSLAGILFLSIYPTYAVDFVFIFPMGIQFISHYTKGYYRSIAQLLFSIGCQSFFFHEINILFILFYSLFKTMYLWIAMVLILGKIFPICMKLIEWIFSIGMDGFTIHYAANVFFILLILCTIYNLMNRKSLRQILILICICFLYIPLQPYTSPFFHVYMLDIGQGDCTLIVEPYLQSVVMIDCGGNLYRDNVQEIVLPFLDNFGIHSIDAFIITHEDFDHSGGKDELIESIEVKQVIESSKDKVSVQYPFLSLLENREVDNENDRSIVSYFSYDDFHYLWMGDASINIEKELLNTYHLEVDVLKLGHHGSSTSSSYAFLDALRPTFGLVSVGYKNKYGHPDNEVISNCYNLGIQTLQTKDVGMIHLFSFHNLLFYETGNGLIGIEKAD